jgi:hypothetical protein
MLTCPFRSDGVFYILNSYFIMAEARGLKFNRKLNMFPKLFTARQRDLTLTVKNIVLNLSRHTLTVAYITMILVFDLHSIELFKIIPTRL